MTIKKIKTANAPVTQKTATPASKDGEIADIPADLPPVSGGGATIADRFKLDAPVEKKSGATVGKKAALAALIAGLIALGVSGLLTFILYQHWVFLSAA